MTQTRPELFDWKLRRLIMILKERHAQLKLLEVCNFFISSLTVQHRAQRLHCKWQLKCQDDRANTLGTSNSSHHWFFFKFLFLFWGLERKVTKYCWKAVSSKSIEWNMVSYPWGILGQARGLTAPRGTEPLLAPMPPPCHLEAAVRCLGQSSSAWWEGGGQEASI